MSGGRHADGRAQGYPLAMSSGRSLAVAFLAVVAAFIASTVWSQRANQRASDGALAISKDLAPEIEALGNTRVKLRLLEARVLRRVAGEMHEEVSEARAELDSSLARDQALVTTEEERGGIARLHAAVVAFELSGERAVEETRLGAKAEALRTVRVELRLLGNEADGVAADLVEVEAKRARLAAENIEASLARANRISFQLDALSALLALVAALLALRSVRTAERAQKEHRQLVERKAAELEMFAGRVAHDILSPLSTVGMALSIVRRDPGSTSAKTALMRSESSLGRVNHIVDGLLEFARAGAQPETGAVTKVGPAVHGLQDELQELHQQENAQLLIEPFEPCAVRCSQGVLLSLLSNLLRNAFKYLGDSPRRQVTLRVVPRRGRVLFEIQDTGPGIAPALAHSLFQPYVRGPLTGKPGIGLGLATVKRLVDSHGGTVAVKPAPGGGSIFWFELASAETTALQEAGETRPSPAHGAGG
jgi:signal transduction histidine kinase